MISIYSTQRILTNLIKSCLDINYGNAHLGYAKYCQAENEITIIISNMLNNLYDDYDNFEEFNNTIKIGNKSYNLAKRLNIYFKKQDTFKNSIIFNYYDEDKTINNFNNRYETIVRELRRYLDR